MKVVISTMCIIALLYSGGCFVQLQSGGFNFEGGSGPSPDLLFLLGAIVLFNLIVLGALLVAPPAGSWVLFICGLADFGFAMFFLDNDIAGDDLWVFSLVAAAKGILTITHGFRRLKGSPS